MKNLFVVLVLTVLVSEVIAQQSQFGVQLEYNTIQNQSVFLSRSDFEFEISPTIPNLQVGISFVRTNSKFEHSFQLNVPTVNSSSDHKSVVRILNGRRRSFLFGEQTMTQFISNYSISKFRRIGRSKYVVGASFTPVFTTYQMEPLETFGYPIRFQSLQLFAAGKLRYEYSISNDIAVSLYTNIHMVRFSQSSSTVEDPSIDIESQRNNVFQVLSSDLLPQFGCSVLYNFRGGEVDAVSQ